VSGNLIRAAMAESMDDILECPVVEIFAFYVSSINTEKLVV